MIESSLWMYRERKTKLPIFARKMLSLRPETNPFNVLIELRIEVLSIVCYPFRSSAVR